MTALIVRCSIEGPPLLAGSSSSTQLIRSSVCRCQRECSSPMKGLSVVSVFEVREQLRVELAQELRAHRLDGRHERGALRGREVNDLVLARIELREHGGVL